MKMNGERESREFVLSTHPDDDDNDDNFTNVKNILMFI